jgi:flagella basal body P-ring formation protein FlgA
MNFKDINDKWKSFLTENAFKEDKLVKKDKKQKAKNKDGKKKELIVSEEDDVNEWEEFEEAVINEPSGSEGNKAINSVEEENLEEMSAMSGGAVQGYAGNAFAPKKKIKPY